MRSPAFDLSKILDFWPGVGTILRVTYRMSKIHLSRYGLRPIAAVNSLIVGRRRSTLLSL